MVNHLPMIIHHFDRKTHSEGNFTMILCRKPQSLYRIPNQINFIVGSERNIRGEEESILNSKGDDADFR